jgi:lysozyme
MEKMNIDALRAQLTIDEGRKSRIYKDTVGKITGGVGRNLTDVPFSDDEIDLMLTNDINKVCVLLDDKLPWWRNLSDRRQQVLANMAFNLGVNGLLGFKNTLSVMQAGQYDLAAEGMLTSKWASQVGNRAIRLAQMMKEG